MTPATHAKGQRIALFGLGGSGLATARALLAGGARVIACDDNAKQMERARAEGIETADLRAIDWAAMSSLVFSPGVPLTHKDGKPFTHWTVALARQRNVEVIGDIELFCRERRAVAPGSPFIAITGTNGKSTTTALVAHILRQAGRDVQMGGNIGAAVLSLEPPAQNRFHVVECSSFQIDLAPSLDPTVGVMLNITPDHLDRHGTMENYAAIKERLVAHAENCVIGIEEAYSSAIWDRRFKKKMVGTIALTTRAMLSGIKIDPPLLISGGQYVGGGDVIADIGGIGSLRGDHNVWNAAAACAVSYMSGVPLESFRHALHTFPGLPHRLEEIGRVGRALFINDSKATNADSSEKALLSFPSDIFWILGGKPKEGGIESLRPHFARVAKAYLIGEATEEFAATLDGGVALEKCGTLDVALRSAARDATQSAASEPVVLLSPACASYDQYANFEARGEHFRTLAQALSGFAPAAAA